MKKTNSIKFKLELDNPERHIFKISCRISKPSPTGQFFSLPSWVPGSYLIRDFSQHIVKMEASTRNLSLGIHKISKNNWSVEPTNEELTIYYEIYAHDRSVRGAFFNSERAFFDGSCVFLQIHGKQHLRHELEIEKPKMERLSKWKVASSMKRTKTPIWSFGTFYSENYENFIDHPFEISEFVVASFNVKKIRHDIVISGKHNTDTKRLSQDLAKLCLAQSYFWKSLPLNRYLFLVRATENEYGGLEHCSSSALVTNRDHLPTKSTHKDDKGYQTFLGLCSHEYFHLWNVKRIKPLAFKPLNLDQENYTRLLWVFEGITSYYDDLMLVRSGLMSESAYLALLAENITRYLTSNGRHNQTLEDSSFDAWIKLYKPNENRINSTVSYYQKGSMVALCLDLLIRKNSDNEYSLDNVMRDCWENYGQTNNGLPENGLESIAQKFSSRSLKPFFDMALRSTRDLPLKSLFKIVGLNLKKRELNLKEMKRKDTNQVARTFLGLLISNEDTTLRVTNVINGECGQRSGLSPGDVLIALNGYKITQNNIKDKLIDLEKPSIVKLHAFRNNELMEFETPVKTNSIKEWILSDQKENSKNRNKEKWLKN